MRTRHLILVALLLLAGGSLRSGQEAPSRDVPKPPEPLFVRLSVYPTASLSRYDYNNDIDLYEVREFCHFDRG